MKSMENKIKVGDIINNLIIDEIIYEFNIVHYGWEMDNIAWIVKDKDGKFLVIETSHGTPYISNITNLERKIKEYEYLIKQTQKAVDFLNQ